MTSTQLLVAILAILMASGCLGGDLPKAKDFAVSADAYAFNGKYTWPDPVVTNSTGAITGTRSSADPAFPQLVPQPVPGYTGEPSIGVTKDNALFTIAGDQTFRSDDHGRTWTNVYTFVSPNYPTSVDRFGTGDPLLYVDPATDRIFVDHLHPAGYCTYITYSDDGGKNWADQPVPVRPGLMDCGVAFEDHQKLLSTRPMGALANVPASARGYPNVLYQCFNKVVSASTVTVILGTWCSVSADGGKSFLYDTQAFPPPSQSCPGLNGQPAAHPDGTVFVPAASFGDVCHRPASVAWTANDGQSWTIQSFPAFEQTETDADLAFTKDGTGYFLVRGADHGVYLLRSHDKFRTWEGPFRVSPNDHVMDIFTSLVVGDDGRIAMLYLGTKTPQELQKPTPSLALEGTRWNLYMTTSLDAEAAEPTFVTQQVNPTEDPVQVGCVWMNGGGGGTRACRNLLDFIDATLMPDGRVAVAFTDGCTPRVGCSSDDELSNGQAHDGQVTVAVMDHGESLLLDKGILPSLGLQYPMPLPRTGADR